MSARATCATRRCDGTAHRGSAEQPTVSAGRLGDRRTHQHPHHLAGIGAAHCAMAGRCQRFTARARDLRMAEVSARRRVQWTARSSDLSTSQRTGRARSSAAHNIRPDSQAPGAAQARARDAAADGAPRRRGAAAASPLQAIDSAHWRRIERAESLCATRTCRTRTSA